MPSFVDDADMWANGQGYGEMMSVMLQDYSLLYETVGGKIQSSKSGSFTWK